MEYAPPTPLSPPPPPPPWRPPALPSPTAPTIHDIIYYNSAFMLRGLLLILRLEKNRQYQMNQNRVSLLASYTGPIQISKKSLHACLCRSVLELYLNDDAMSR